jgi:uncharacterized membrane protein
MRLFRHPVHPMLVAFPIALLALTPVWDVLAVVGVMKEGRATAYYSEAAGLIAAGLAIIAGFADLMKIPQSETANAKVALIHAGLALTMVSLFGVAFAMRGGAAGQPGTWVLVLEAAGALCLAVTGWFGGDLVFRRGVGVEAAESVQRPAL